MQEFCRLGGVGGRGTRLASGAHSGACTTRYSEITTNGASTAGPAPVPAAKRPNRRSEREVKRTDGCSRAGLPPPPTPPPSAGGPARGQREPARSRAGARPGEERRRSIWEPSGLEEHHIPGFQDSRPVPPLPPSQFEPSSDFHPSGPPVTPPPVTPIGPVIHTDCLSAAKTPPHPLPAWRRTGRPFIRRAGPGV